MLVICGRQALLELILEPIEPSLRKCGKSVRRVGRHHQRPYRFIQGERTC
jgi:hypothetical protein